LRLSKAKAAQQSDCFRRDSFARHKHVKAFSHAAGNQMLKLKRDFRALWRQATFFEGVGKLVGSPIPSETVIA